ncbi:MAG: response regulator transcription factor [Planctomycetota bacterium]
MAYLLIIDDDEDFASAAAKMLHDAGHEVAVELDTASAVASMEKRRPDLVILDVMFPEDASAGFQLARTMRHYNENLKGIPVLMLTAVNSRFPLGFSSHDIDENWLPVADFLEKPVDLDVLRNRVAGLLGRPEPQTSSPGEEA